MAIELARTALWLEGFEEGRPLSFLDHHLQVGDALWASPTSRRWNSASRKTPSSPCR
jgi:hypothetical protein